MGTLITCHILSKIYNLTLTVHSFFMDTFAIIITQAFGLDINSESVNKNISFIQILLTSILGFFLSLPKKTVLLKSKKKD